MKRPPGVLLAAIVLGFIAALQGLSAFGMMLAGATMRHGGLPNSNPNGPPPPPPQVVAAVFFGMALVLLLLAVWAGTTVYGLIRLRKWARYSILTMGGLLAAFGLLSIAMIGLMPSILAGSQGPETPPGLMHGLLVFMGLFYFGLAALGTWWLVYFNLRSVKAYFLPGYALQQQQMYPPSYAQSAASLATPGGLYDMPPPPVPYALPPPGRLAGVPTSIIVIAVLYFLAALSCAGCMFLPWPGFFAGLIFPQPWARLFYAAFALLMFYIGVGLLRLDNRARLVLYGYSALSLLSMVVVLTPWGRGRYELYQQQVQAAMQLGSRPSPNPAGGTGIYAAILIFCVIVYAVQVWLIERHRKLFTEPKPVD